MSEPALAREILAMLELRDSAALPAWVAGRLASLCGAASQRVLRVFPGSVIRKPGSTCPFAVAALDDGLLGEVKPGSDGPMLAAIESRAPVDEGGRWLVPFHAGDEARYLVEVQGAGDASALRGAESFVSVARRYFEVLAEGETDPLTRLGNRRTFYSQAGAALAGWAARGGTWRFLAVADIDHFKQVNDRFGHLYGDEILIHFAALMRRTFRAGDLLFRFGGEEFVLVFETRLPGGGARALERFRSAVERHDFPLVGGITASFGYTEARDAAEPVTTLIDRADKALYYAKEEGRNRVCGYESLVASGAIGRPAAAGGEATLF